MEIYPGTQKIDFLKFQIEEITNSKIQNINEFDELMQERSILLNSEELKTITYSGYELLYNQDSSLIDVLNSFKNKLIKASEFDENLSKLAEIIDSSSINLKEVANELRDYSENLEISPARLYQLEERIEILNKLKRKYGPELSDVLKNLEKFELELSEINFSDEKIQELSKKVVELKNETAENPPYAIIFITEELAVTIEKDDYKKLSLSALPAIIPVPGSKGATGYGVKRIGKMVEQAIGSDILG